MKNKKTLLMGAGLVVLIALFAVIYTNFLPHGNDLSKTITVEVVANDETTSHTIKTEEEFLRGALEQEKLAEGSDSEYGLYILTVDGITADESAQQWWSVKVGGEMAETSVDSIALEDGVVYTLELVTGW